MLEEAPDDRAHADAVGAPGQAGRQHAGAAHDQVDRHAGLAGADQRLDQRDVGQRIDLDDDARAAARPRRLLDLRDMLQQPPVQA